MKELKFKGIKKFQVIKNLSVVQKPKHRTFQCGVHGVFGIGCLGELKPNKIGERHPHSDPIKLI
ncbi:hypothetical protein [Vibrio methylphosphonaticus]|uniref:hypothetical protein n=1 Tax=Vibrio methylphosphonaticus TaxID=2946866 RepID=UPI00202A75F6|nr:hypothetical protein [Vibrio methylphosphonaticus]MCL9776190.1 hypothetical protein [Vibrio methylphosphonaticus]